MRNVPQTANSTSATLIQIQNAEKVVKAVEEYLKAEKII